MAAPRARFATKAGFILSGVGAAVGLGNIWRFPQLASQNGGAAFVFVYVLCLLGIGIPLLWAELAVGQRAQRSPAQAFAQVAGTRWKWVGFMFLASTFVLFGYYQVIAGLVLKFVLFAPSDVIAADPARFLAESSTGGDALLFASAFAVITFLVIVGGVQKGLERANLVLMPALFAIVALLAVYALFQPGAGEGVRFYLGVNFSEITMQTFRDAIGQVFFSVGIGFGLMLTFASYTESRGKSLFPSAMMIASSDLLVALTSGLMIFPLVFAMGLQGDVVGQELSTNAALFLTMPMAFLAIGGVLGKAFMLLFFLMLAFAALSTTIALLEVLVSWLKDARGWSRPFAAFVATVYGFTPGVIAAYFGGVLTWLDTLLGTVLLVVGALGMCVAFAVAIKHRDAFLLGNGGDASTRERSTARAFGALIAFVVPLFILAIFVLNLPCTLNGLLFLDLPTPTC